MLKREDYDEIREASKTLDKGDRNEVLSNYFTAKRSMRNGYKF